MNQKPFAKKSLDGNEAAAHVAYFFSEVCALYPITPSTPMGELVDEWAQKGKKNLFGESVTVAEMQSEGGAAGALHGALASGALASTFTASQGLLLMIPNMYKIAGELMPMVMHVSARALARQALSIFGDHQDVMACRETGFALLCSGSVQEVMDLALVAHLSTLRASIPFVHFFDGFRTSHEIQKIEGISEDVMRELVDFESIKKHQRRALNPGHPHVRGTAQNPDIYFQLLEAANPFYLAVPKIVEEEMDKLFHKTNRRYHLFDYVGHPEATKVLVMMGSGAEAAEECVNYLLKKNERVGLVKVRLYRPFSKEHFLHVLPKSVKRMAVLDRTKEPGSLGEPLFLDVATVLKESNHPAEVFGGRFGLGSKEFTPSMVKALFDQLSQKEFKQSFTLGITDDVTFLSIPVKEKIDSEHVSTMRCKFWGLGGDGTVGANKEAIKLIGDHTDKYVQGYFAYDSKKTSGLTISHLRFGDEPIHSTYGIETADYIACHHPSYVWKYDVLEGMKEGGTFVLNAPWTALETLEEHLPNKFKKELFEKKCHFFVIDAWNLAKELGLGGRINMIMQTLFFWQLDEKIISFEKAKSLLKEAVEKTYKKKGLKVVEMNQKAIDAALKNVQKITPPAHWGELSEEKILKEKRPKFVEVVADVMNAEKGNTLPVGAFTPGGIFPMETTKFEKRSIALELPEWINKNCIQCNQCAYVCPHAAIRPFLRTKEEKEKAPREYQGIKAAGGKAFENFDFSIEISPYDCTGCTNCVVTCPAKEKALVMKPKEEMFEKEKKLWDFAQSMPLHIPETNKFSVKGSQFQKPLLEFSGACAGCGETPYVKLLTQLFGERMIIANATGCSSIWGASAPAIPWAVTSKGFGPAWGNSLFEDNAEYGFGMLLSYATRRGALVHLVEKALQSKMVSENLAHLFSEWLQNVQNGNKSFELAEKIKPLLFQEKKNGLVQELQERADLFSKPSVWIIGGDGWAYDIGFGGLDHVMAMNQDVNILVLDTEVYSNTGGQASKATPMGAVAKFAASGKKTFKKDLGKMMMTYGNGYIASVAMGADQAQVVKAFKEAEEFAGPSLVIAYAPCIAHGMAGGLGLQKQETQLALDCGYWINYRYDPRLKKENKNPFQLDSKEPTKPLLEFLEKETRYQSLMASQPELARTLQESLEQEMKRRYQFYKKLSEEIIF